MTEHSPRVEPDLRAVAQKIATEVAAPAAHGVDTNCAFPAATFAALRSHGLLGAMVPVAYGGRGIGLKQTADICAILARQCPSTAMIFAMHQIQVASLVFCADSARTGTASNDWLKGLLARVAADKVLLGSATTELEVGGSLRTSVCAVEPAGEDRFTIRKNASVISYGEAADAIMVTARRNAASPASDQVMVVVERGQYELQHCTRWDTLGMRGTCSDGFVLTARAPTAQILPRPFAEIASDSMLAVSHLLWGSVWYGIAADAIDKSQSCMRAHAKKVAQDLDIAGFRLAEAVSQLTLIRSALQQGLEAHEIARLMPENSGAVDNAVALNLLKVNVSEMAADVVLKAMLICGVHAYRNDGPYSLGRHLRDVLSARLMINNDRILGNSAQLLRIARINGFLSGA